MNESVKLLTIMVRGAYDLQKLRMQMGLRLVGNFRAKLKPPQASSPDIPSEPITASNPRGESAPPNGRKPKRRSVPAVGSNPVSHSEPARASNPGSTSDIDEEGEKLLDQLRASYQRLTDGVAKHRTLPAEKGFHGDEIISTYAELVLVHQYIAILREEEKQFRMLTSQLEHVPIYQSYLKDVIGIGPAMAGVLIGWFDPYKARHVSSFWKYCGLDVGPDGRGRSRRAEHLVEREYRDKNGDIKTRMSITYDPFLKSKMMGVLAGSFLRRASPWRDCYDGYKHRLETDPHREKVTVVEWKKRNRAGEDVRHLWTPGRINDASKRYMVKMFLADFWWRWRALEGLPVTEPYSVAKLGQRPHAAE